MSKTISWPARVTYIFIALALALSLAGMTAVSADPAKESEWDDVSTPSMDDFVIAPGSDILDFDIGPDGEIIYAVGFGKDEDGTGDVEAKLWKSEDGGITWDDFTDELEDDTDFVASTDSLNFVAVSQSNADFVVVTGTDGEEEVVYGSDDGASNWSDLGFETVAGADFTIECLDVSVERDDTYNVAVGAYNSTHAGVVWRYQAGAIFGGAWKNTSTYDGWSAMQRVTSVAFSPNFDADDTVLAVSLNTTAEEAYLQQGEWASTKAWNDASQYGDAIEITKEVDANVAAIDPSLTTENSPSLTGIALPSDYTGYDSDLRYSWVYVNYEASANATAYSYAISGNYGHVFEIDGSKSYPADTSCSPNALSKDDYPVLASIAMTGTIEGEDSALMVGAADGAACAGIQVYRTGEWPIYSCCPDWDKASKKPTGTANCLVAYTPDGSKAYAATSNPTSDSEYESAFSMSELEVVGKYWNQLSLIDTYIDKLSDVAVNPACGSIYLFSINANGLGDCNSVWLSTDEGDSYMRIWCGLLEGDPENGLLRFNPEETDEVLNIYLVDQGVTKTEYGIYWNDDGGLTKWTGRKVTTLGDLEDIAVLDESIIYAVDSDGKVSKSEHNGSRWETAVKSKVSTGHTIAVQDDYVLVGGEGGSVGYSDDAGDSFSRLGKSGALSGKVHVAFDSYFEDNDTVYAAVSDATSDNGIYRWVIDDSTSWKDLLAGNYIDLNDDDKKDAGEPWASYYGIVLDNADGNRMTDEDTGGVLYAVYATANVTSPYSGVARWLEPCTAKPKAAYWDYLVNGIDISATEWDAGFITEPSALKLCGCLTEDSNSLLWAIDADGYDLAEGENNLFNYEDCLAKAGVELSSVADGKTVAADPCECENAEFVLEWDELCNSSDYELEIALDEDFDLLVEKPPTDYNPAEVDDEYKMVAKADLECSRTYYWRVRVTTADDGDETIRSWWSSDDPDVGVWSFTVAAGPGAAIDLTSPDDGDTGIAITGIGFTWSAVAEATSYDWVLSANADLSSPVATKTGLTGTAYTYTGTLDYDTTYFWQVTAMKDANILSVSDVSTFTTTPAAVFTCPQCGLSFPTEAALKAHVAEAHAPVEPFTPAWVWVVIGLGAVLVITIIVLIFRTRRV